MSPTTRPSGCAVSSNCMMRSRGSVPMAENMSAYLATRSLDLVEEAGLAGAAFIFRYYRKYGLCQARVALAQGGSSCAQRTADGGCPYIRFFPAQFLRMLTTDILKADDPHPPCL